MDDVSFQAYVMAEQYARVKGLGDRLELMKDMIDWEPFRPIVASVYRDGTSVGGRPHTDEVVIVKCMLLQVSYGLSDPELEYQCADRLSFRNFLGYPEGIPHFSTIWKARDRLVKAGLDQEIWDELQRQQDEQGYKIKKGVIQDASIEKANPGRKRRSQERKHEKETGKLKTYTPKQLSHIDNDAAYTVKNGQIHYGYKLHAKMDVDHQLIRSVDVTAANTADNQVDLIEEGDVAAFRDKGYTGTPLKTQNVRDETMLKNTRKRKLNGGQQRKNKRISKTRALGERPFAVIKQTFKNTKTHVTTLSRNKIKDMWKCFAYNLYQLVTLQKQATTQTT